MTTVLHVAISGSDSADGSPDNPLRTINQAAARAEPGDRVVVHDGEYREWVRPVRGGLSDSRRIVFEAAEGAHVVIKGSERVTDWEPQGDGVWKAEVPGALFGDFNPFTEELAGDWLLRRADEAPKHLGEVYLNGRSLYEVGSVAEVSNPAERTENTDGWTGTGARITDPSWTRYVWHADVEQDVTTIWANFHQEDPTTELVEINVRRSVFFPTEHHIDYIDTQLDAITERVILEKQGEVAQEFDQIHTVHRATEVGSLDGVITPDQLRPAIIAVLDRAQGQ